MRKRSTGSVKMSPVSFKQVEDSRNKLLDALERESTKKKSETRVDVLGRDMRFQVPTKKTLEAVFPSSLSCRPTSTRPQRLLKSHGTSRDSAWPSILMLHLPSVPLALSNPNADRRILHFNPFFRNPQHASRSTNDFSTHPSPYCAVLAFEYAGGL